jgi:hypothetical protein
MQVSLRSPKRLPTDPSKLPKENKSMTNLTRRPPQSVLSAPQERTRQPDAVLAAQVFAARRAGIVAAVRIQSGAFAASSAVHSAAMVSQAADTAFRISPLGESEYRGLVMAFGNFARAEIEGLSFHEGER